MTTFQPSFGLILFPEVGFTIKTSAGRTLAIDTYYNKAEDELILNAEQLKPLLGLISSIFDKDNHEIVTNSIQEVLTGIFEKITSFKSKETPTAALDVTFASRDLSTLTKETSASKLPTPGDAPPSDPVQKHPTTPPKSPQDGLHNRLRNRKTSLP